LLLESVQHDTRLLECSLAVSKDNEMSLGQKLPELWYYPLDRNGFQPIWAARTTTSPHVQKWSLEAILFIKSSLVANKTFCQSEL
jgi:hypothetical protein